MGAGEQGGCPLGSHPQSGCAGAGGQSSCSWGTHPPHLRRVTSWSSTPGSCFSQAFPKVSVVSLWGCVQLLKNNLPAEILHELSQLIICKIPKVCLQLVWGPPTQVKVTRGKLGFVLSFRGQRLGARRFSIYHCHIGPHMGSRRWRSPNSNGFFAQCQCFHDPTCHDL